jgi:alpha-galactosidase
MKFFCLLAMFMLALSPGLAQTKLTSRQEQILAAAASRPAPRFNGAQVIGVRPNTPLLFRLAVSGARPIEFSAGGLPTGLVLDPRTGLLNGTLPHAGKFTFTASAANGAGKTFARFTIVCGDTLALTPPMGWNSYDAFGDNVVESEVLSNADYLAEKMQPFGWHIVVVDYRWYDPGAHNNNPNDRANAPLVMDQFGRLLPAPNRFPSAAGGTGFKPLADGMHAMGLQFGIHMMRGIPRNAVKANLPIAGSNFTAAEAADTNDTCGWCPDMFGVRSNAAGQAWYDSCAQLWASWGVDYIKVDDLSSPYHTDEIAMIRRAIDRCARSIVFSTSPGETPLADAANVMAHANLWRVSGDFWDNWRSLEHEFALALRWQPYVGPGHWPDADMLPVGHLSIHHRSVGDDRFSVFTRDEELTLLSFWCLLPSPLMVGANLPDNDPWTLALLTNPEVLAVNQDSLGAAARQMMAANGIEVWVKPLHDGSHAVGIFNRGQSEDFDESRALYRSPLITRQTPANSVDIDLDVTGAKKLWLVVDDGGDGNGYDHADWLNPRLSGPSGMTNLTDVKWRSATAGWNSVNLNRSVAGGPLNVDGHDYANGIGTHATSIIEYDLPAGYTHFKTRAGLDRSGVLPSSNGATVHFLVFTNSPLFPPAIVKFHLDLNQIGLSGRPHVRDLWLRQDLGRKKEISADIPPHGCLLLKVNSR